MESAKKSRVDSDSPESDVTPYEDIHTRQIRITGEKFPTLALGVCDNCYWCYTLINEKGAINVCSVCRGNVSQIPMNIDEISVIERDKKRGLTVTFDRKLPLR